MLMEGFSVLMLLITLAVLCLAVFAFIDAAMRRDDAYRAADKKTKPFWLIILGLSVAVSLLFGLSILTIVGVIASIVYIVEVRPALKQVMGGGRGPRRGSSSDGPYGPFKGR